jgi:hypothetical protein
MKLSFFRERVLSPDLGARGPWPGVVSLIAACNACGVLVRLSRTIQGLRKAVAILCIAMAAFLSFQTFIGLMDRMEHAHHHVHFPNPLAGDIEDCGGALGVCTDGSDGSHDPLTHHHGDASLVFLAAPFVHFPICPKADSRCVAVPQSFAGIRPRVPEHPPKSVFETRV